MTSIEWLEQIAKSMVINGGDLGEDYPALMVHIQQAKEMHKQEIIDFARHCLNKAKDTDILTAFINTQQYYQETFGSKGSDTLKDYHIVDTNEMVEDDVEKLSEEWIDKNSHKWSNNTNEVGDNYGSFVAGYNKAKETLFIQSLKQPKKD